MARQPPRKCCPTLVKKHGAASHKSHAERLGALEVNVAHWAAQWRQAKAALGREHGLGAGREAGERLCQLVRQDGRLVAVLVWCAATYLQAHAGLLPRSLALDDKSVMPRALRLIITPCRHEDGRPVAMAMTVARGKKEDTSQRLAGATQALKETPFLN